MGYPKPINHFEAARRLQVGQSLEWHYAPLCNTMIRECLGDCFQVSYITTNWEASQGYTLITRIAESEADRIRRENEARVSSPAYRKTEAKVMRSQRSIRREVR
jgi:hypothetical protein